MKTIEVTVSPKGEVTVETKGFAGRSCKAASEALEKALGVVKSDKPTPEMYQTAKQGERLWNSQ